MTFYPHLAELLNMANSGNNNNFRNQRASTEDRQRLAPSDVDIPLLKACLWIS